MTTLIKTLNITNAELNVITAGRRLPLARFDGKIEINEIKNITPILGRPCKGEKIIHASFMLCEDIEYQTQNDFNSEALGDVQGESSCERLLFSGLRYEDMDVLSGKVTFEITDLELIRKMLDM